MNNRPYMPCRERLWHTHYNVCLKLLAVLAPSDPLVITAVGQAFFRLNDLSRAVSRFQT